LNIALLGKFGINSGCFAGVGGLIRQVAAVEAIVLLTLDSPLTGNVICGVHKRAIVRAFDYSVFQVDFKMRVRTCETE